MQFCLLNPNMGLKLVKTEIKGSWPALKIPHPIFIYDSFEHKSCGKHIYFDSKWNFWFDGTEIFWVRPRKNSKSVISQNAWAELKFWIKIRNLHKIPRRMIYSNNRFYMLLSNFQSNSRLRRRGTQISLKIFTRAFEPIIIIYP